MQESVTFTVKDQRLFGMLERPTSHAERGVIFLGGWAGTRVGPHQIFVKLTRQLSARGIAGLRFDFRGRGDSEGETGSAELGTMLKDVIAAVQWMVQRTQVTKLTLLGICSGSQVAMGACQAHPAIDSLILWSTPSVPEAVGQRGSARRRRLFVLREYAGKLFRTQTWRKLFTLRLRPKTIGRVIWSESPPPTATGVEQHCLDQFRQFEGRTLFVHGTNDPETKPALAQYLPICEQRGTPHQVHLVRGANHSFYSVAWEEEVLRVSMEWLQEA